MKRKQLTENITCVSIIHQTFTFDIKLLHCGIQADVAHKLQSVTIERHVFNYVIEGSGTLTMNGKQFRIKKGDLFWVPAYQQYSQTGDPNDPIKHFYLAFTGNQCEFFLSKAGFSVDSPVITTDNPAFFDDHLRHIFNCLQQNTFYSSFKAIILFEEMLLKLYKSQPKNHTKINLNFQELVDQAQLYIYSNYNMKISAKDVCKYLYISYSYFAPIFKQHTGFSLNNYILNCRMDKVLHLLTSTQIPITRIAEQAGFDDYSNFYRTFMAKTKTSPQKYRLAAKKQ